MKCCICQGRGREANFGGLCDQCDDERKARLVRSAKILDQYGAVGHEAAVLRQAARRYGY